jgi:hypothetical protein
MSFGGDFVSASERLVFQILSGEALRARPPCGSLRSVLRTRPAACLQSFSRKVVLIKGHAVPLGRTANPQLPARLAPRHPEKRRRKLPEVSDARTCSSRGTMSPLAARLIPNSRRGWRPATPQRKDGSA